MVEAVGFNLDEYMDSMIPSPDYEGYEYEQFCLVTDEGEETGQTVAIILSRFQNSDDHTECKLVTLKIITNEYLKAHPKNR